MRYRPSTNTEYMFKIMRVQPSVYAGGEIRMGPYASGFTYNLDNRWHAAIRGRLRMCSNGYHLLRLKQICQWLTDNPISSGHRIFLVKADMKDALIRDNKIAVKNFKTVCELETSGDFLKDALKRSITYYGRGNSPRCPKKLAGLAKRWGLDMKDWKVVGEYEDA